MRSVEIAPVRETMNGAGGATNTARPLTRSLDLGKEGLAMKATRIDLTGKRFSSLVVLRYVGGSQCAWECRCDCGTVKAIAGSDLRRGRTHSCGCRRTERISQSLRLSDMTGQKFGRLTVVAFVEMRSGESFWRCACDCGGELEVRGWSLRQGGTKSCGCLHRERVREDRTDAPTYSTVHTRLRVTRGSARDHSCVDCGDAAEQWSYDHSDPDELISSLGHPFSADLDRYVPRCCSCHRVFDAAHGGAHA